MGIQRLDQLAQAGALLVEGLCPIRVLPDLGLFQFTLDFGQALAFAGVVKDTP